MQPTYLPWAGYFNLIGSVDCFVFLDDVSFQKQSWQTRNRILLNGRLHWLVVPVKRACLSTLIQQVRISDHDPKWAQRHWKTIQMAYKNAPFSEELFDILSPIYSSPVPMDLAFWNTRIIKSLSEALGVQTKFMMSSELNCVGGRTKKLIGICERLGATTYRAPAGAEDYLNLDRFSERSGIVLEIQRFNPAPYEQFGVTDFLSHLSVLDVIAYLGVEGARRYIQRI